MKAKRSYLVEREDEELFPGLFLSYRIQVDTRIYGEPGNETDPPWSEEFIDGITYEEVRLRVAVDDDSTELTLPLPKPNEKRNRRLETLLEMARDSAEKQVQDGAVSPYWEG